MAFPSADYAVTEKLHESHTTLVYRGRRTATGQPIVIKILKPEAATADGLAHMRREFTLLSRLNLPGVIQIFAWEPYHGSLALVMEDIGGRSLDRFLDRFLAHTPLDLRLFLPVAIELAGILGGIHRQRIVHKDINPAHIIWNPETAQIRLIDFGLADDRSQQHVELRHPAALEGTLAYISPEQTGRMNRPVDYRTDFYSLGITFYQMLTGALPFAADDALGLVHYHIAKTALPPHELNPAVPEMVSAIVMKLMAKMAEDRYQNAGGLQADLERCLREMTAAGDVPPFELGQEDISEQFQIPQKLYGRTAETGQLLAAFERACAGGRELFAVGGYAGVGKTALVHEIHRPVTEKRGNFIEGKFDQWQRNIPYRAWIQAFTGLVNDLLMENEALLSAWKQRILAAVGGSGKVLTDVIPDWELVIGPQPDVLPLPPTEAQNRFRRVFQDLTRVFATAEHPLTVFLDDLQWADQASVQLIEALSVDSELTHFLLIGAFREAEMDSAHPVTRFLEKPEKTGYRYTALSLQPLRPEHVQQLLAETLHCEAEQVRELARLVQAKTDGNPFFVGEFLKTLHENHLLTFEQGWQWDLERIRQADISDNVVDLMIGKMAHLPAPTGQALKVAACIGVEFDLSLLARVRGQSVDETRRDLQEASREGLVVVSETSARFIHDKVGEAAYALTTEDERAEFHYQIGKTLLDATPEDRWKEEVFRIAEQLNAVRERLTAAEKTRLIQVNVLAARRAKASSAHEAACRYFRQAAFLLPDDAWETDYAATLSLHSDWAEAEYMAIHYPAAEALFDLILRHARTLLDKIRINQLQIVYYEATMRYQDVVALTLSVLHEIGVPFLPPDQIDQAATQAQLERFFNNLSAHPVATLIDLPEAVSPYQEAIGILAAAAVPFWAAYPHTTMYEMLAGANLSIERGLCPASAMCLTSLAAALCSELGQSELGYALGELALNITERFNDVVFRPAVAFVFYNMICLWHHPLRYGPEQLLQTYHDGAATGNNQWAAYCINHYCMRGLWAGDNLETVKARYDQLTAPLYRLKQADAYAMFNPPKQVVYNLLGHNPANLYQLEGEFFSESQEIPQWWASNYYGGIGLASACKLLLLCCLGDFAGAWRLITAPGIEECLQANVGQYQHCLLFFFTALTLLQNYGAVSATDQETVLQKAQTMQAKLKTWADQYPPNFLPLYGLVSAEVARVKGEDWTAVDFYGRAIDAAHAQEFTYIEALAHELAAKFWLERHQEAYARLHIIAAHDAYRRWGAQAKVVLLLAAYPQWLASKAGPEPAPGTSPLDVNTVLKASQAMTSEIDLDRLLGQIMSIVIENAGAEKGILIENKAEGLVVQAKGQIGWEQVETMQETPVEKSGEVPLSVVYYVAHTQTPVVLPDACHDHTYAADPYIAEHQTRSLLCLPIVHQGKLSGLVVLENNLATNVFTPDRLELLSALAAQAAISMDNAGLYTNLERANVRLAEEIAERTRAEAAEREQRILAEALRDTAAVLTGTLDTGKVMTSILESVGRVVPHDRANIMLIDGEAARFAYWHNYPDDYEPFFHTFTLPLTTPHLHEMIVTAAPVVVADVETYEGWVHVSMPEWTDPHAYVGVPIRVHGQVIGFLNLDSTQVGFFTAAHAERLQAFADQAAVALENAQLYDEIRRHVDQLEHLVSERTNELDQERARLQAILEEMAEAVIYIDLASGQTQYVNRAFAELTGCNPAEVIAQPMPVYNEFLDGPEEYDKLANMIDHLVSRRTTWRGTLQARRRDGIPLELELTASAVRGPGEHLVGVVVLARDIGPERALQAQKDRFIASASHELRTPITNLKLRLYLIRRQPQKWQQHLAVIETTANHMAALIESLLEVSRFERGVIELQRETVVLQDVVAAAVTECQLQAENRHIQINSKLQDKPLYIDADPIRIRQVAENLIINAINYTPEGGQITIEAFAEQNRDDAYAIFRVRDSGIGIAPEDIARLFEPFYRVAGSQALGTGLGLTISKEIVDLHGGKIVVESQINQGSVFSVSLPPAAAP